MPLFEFDEGHLIPAQFGRTVPNGLTDDILKSVREQVLEIVGRPLFPITWQDGAPVGSGMDGGAPRLTALDASGQVVSVEVIERLDSQAMIDSLSRLADTASLGWTDLAMAYPGGMQSFRNGWTEFRDAMPPSPAPGPRLVLVVGSISDSVRPALDVLATSGVEVHEIAVRAMSNGRMFIDVRAVGPRLYGHNPNLLLGQTAQPIQLEALREQSEQIEDFEAGPAAHAAPERSYDPWETASTEEESQRRGRHEAPVTATAPTYDARSEAPAAPVVDPWLDTRAEEPAPTRRSRRQALAEPEAPAEPEALALDNQIDSAEADTVPQIARGVEALEVIADILADATPLSWTSPGRSEQAMLSRSGEISTPAWSTKDPNEAAAMVTGSSEYDGWAHWHLGDAMGPSLAEALEEINNEIRHEYENLGSPKQGRRAR